MAKPLPRAEDLISYDQAVAGHDGVMSDADHILFIKPCTPAEAGFYETTIAEHPDFAELMPTFIGRLELAEDQAATLEEQGAALIAQRSLPEPYVPTKNRKIPTNLAVVLENAAHGFKRPNVLDVKLGVRLWADDAHPDKKTRFDKVTQETTHKNLGFRIAGMRVWQGNNAEPNGVIDKDGYKIYDKDYGKLVTDDNVSHAFHDFFFSKSAGMDAELSKLMMEAFLTDLELVQQTLENQESRMYSASLLFVFEGDGDALRTAMEEASRSLRYVNGDGANHRDDSDDDSDIEDDGPKIYTLKVIDFAHAFWVPGEGPDENSLLGVRSVIRILKDLRQDA
ncbi:MAG: hypothetical protein M1818_006169 [Claussenomyces sp. TS43310]|nr:MAG: hypothetical protein M1818_006169 [Claussenomyces sp. TS43310]